MNLFGNRDKDFDDDDVEGVGNDFFEADPVPETPREKAPKVAEPTPDDPKYWESEDAGWESVHPRSRWRIWSWVVGVVAVLGIVFGIYIYLFTPYEREVVQYGYVEKIGYKGTLFKTFEGTVIPYREMMDTSRTYDRDFVFSAANEKVATRIKFLEKSGLPVRLEYNVYHISLPWRGETKIVVTAADSVPPSVTLIR